LDLREAFCMLTLMGHYMILRGISWATKDKIQQANYFGSLTQASAIRVGSYQGEEIYAPFKSLLPMVFYHSFKIQLFN